MEINRLKSDPCFIWIVHPKFFDDDKDKYQHRREKANNLIELLCEAYSKGVPVGVTPRPMSGEIGINRQIYEACRPIYDTENILKKLLEIKKGTVLFGGAHLRHGWLDSSDEKALPKNYIPVQLPQNYAHRVISHANNECCELIPIESCIASMALQINKLNQEKGTNLEAVIDSRITLPMFNSEIIENSFYRARFYLKTGFLASVESVDAFNALKYL